MWEWISSPWGTLVLGILTAIPISGFYFYLAKNWAEPQFFILNSELVGHSNASLPSDITIIHNGKNIECVSRTRVFFWNAGHGPLRKDDIAVNDKLRIDIESGEFLASDLRKVSSQNIVASTEITEATKSSCFIKFEYLNKMDGFVVDLYHSSRIMPKTLKGTFVGKVSKPINVYDGLRSALVSGQRKGRNIKRYKTLGWVFLIFGMLTMGFGYVMKLHPEVISVLNTMNDYIYLLFFPLGMSYVLLGLFNFYIGREIIPKELRVE